MSCSVQVRDEEKTCMEEWSSLFPNYSTFSGSCLFIKKLIAVAVSTVTYVRYIFPEEAYGNRYLAGMKLKILTEGSNCPGATRIINLIRNLYDAVEKKYLQQLKIGICVNPENTEEAIEAFNFRFNYTDDEDAIADNTELSSLQNTKNDPTYKATLLLLKNIFFVNERLGRLPDKAFLTLKLLYNDDITPPDYEPPGFQPSENEKFVFSGESVSIMLGKVSTPYHSCRLLVKTVQKSFLTEDPEDPMVSQNNSCQNEQNSQEILDDDSFAEIPHSSSQVSKSGKQNTKSHQSNKDIILDSIVDDSVETNEEIACPCKFPVEGKECTVTCTVCHKKQHQICYGFLYADGIPNYFACVKCVERNYAENAQNDRLYCISESDQEALCLVRKALFICSTLETVTVTTLKTKLKLDSTLTKALLSRLETEGFIKKGAKGKKYVDKENIESKGFQEYFPFKLNENKENCVESDNVDISMRNLTMDSQNESYYVEPTGGSPKQVLRISKRKRTPKKQFYLDDSNDFSQNSRKRARKVSENKKDQTIK